MRDSQHRQSSPFGALPPWLKEAVRFFSSWSVRVGLLLLFPLLLYPPWRQQFMLRVDGGDLIPVRAVRHRLIWDPPWNSEIAVGRLLIELFALLAVVLLAYQYERIWRRTRKPSKGAEDYSHEDWMAGVRQQREGRSPSVCPSCQRTGFHGPREDRDGRQLRLCMFCGTRQYVGEGREKLVPCVHSCGKVAWVAGAQQITWVGAQEREFECAFCGGVADVQESRVVSPIDDPEHPWWDVPQGLSHEAYVRFWLRNGAPGRAFL